MWKLKPDKFKEECGVFGIFGHPEAANLAYLDAELRPTPHWVLGASAEYQGRSYIDPSNEVWIDPYTLVNVRAAYRWRAKGIHGEVVGIVRNLFNTSYIAFTEPDPDGNSYHPGPTREVFAGVRVVRGPAPHEGEDLVARVLRADPACRVRRHGGRPHLRRR